MCSNHFSWFVKQPYLRIFFNWSVHTCLSSNSYFIFVIHTYIAINNLSIYLNHASLNQFFCHSSWCYTHSWQSFWKSFSFTEIFDSTNIYKFFKRIFFLCYLIFHGSIFNLPISHICIDKSFIISFKIL
jgi:hypothetical protein